MKTKPVLQSDDRLFVENVYRNNSEWMKKRACKITGDENVCEDLIHDCVIIFIKHIYTLKKLDEDRLRLYLAVLIDSTAKNYAVNSEYLPSSCEDDMADISADIEEIIEHRIRCETVRQKLCELKDRDRKMIMMKYILRLHDREIANILGIKEESVRMTVRRSVTRLKKKLGVVKSYESVQ